MPYFQFKCYEDNTNIVKWYNNTKKQLLDTDTTIIRNNKTYKLVYELDTVNNKIIFK